MCIIVYTGLITIVLPLNHDTVKTIYKFVSLLIVIVTASTMNIFAQSNWTNPNGDAGQPLMEIWIYGATGPHGSLVAGDQIAAFDGETLVGLLTLTGTPSSTNWGSFRLLAYSKNTDGDQLFTPGHSLTIKCFDSDQNIPFGEKYDAYTWGDGEHIDFHNEWYAPTSDIESTATTYGAFFPTEGASSYCYVDLTFSSVPISYNAYLEVSVFDDQTPAIGITNADVSSGAYIATNNNDGTYTLNLFAGEDITPPVDFNYVINIDAPTFNSETFNYTVQGNNNNGNGYNQEVYLNTTGELSGVIYCYNILSGLYDSLAEGAMVSTEIDGITYSSLTNNIGEYLIENIPDGLWEFTVAFPGYFTDNESVIIAKDLVTTYDANLNLEEGTIVGEVFKATSLMPITDETIKISLLDSLGNELASTTTNNGEYSISYYAGTYDIVVEDNNIGTDPEYTIYTKEDYILYPDVTVEMNFTLMPDPFVPNYDPITGDTNKMWTIKIELAKFGANFLLPYDEIVLFDIDQDPDPNYPDEPGKRVGVLHFVEQGVYINQNVNVLEAYAEFTNGDLGFVEGNNMEFWGYDVSHDAVYYEPIDWWFNTAVGTYAGTTFPNPTEDHISLLNIYWGTVPGILSGEVTEKADPNIAISGVTVEALNVYTQEVVETELTDVDGAYSVLLDNGTYDIRFTKDGFYSETVEDITIEENVVSNLDVELDEQTPITVNYSFTEHGFYFVGRSIEQASNDMLTLVDNVSAGDPIFSANRQNSWIENDNSIKLSYTTNSIWEPQPYNWDLLEGYQIYLESPYDFSMYGFGAIPELNSIEFTSPGIYYVPYFPYDNSNPDDALTAFASIFNELDWVMDSEGNRLHNDNGPWIDNIGLLSSTEGYKVKMNTPATLTYPTSAGKSYNNRVLLDPVHYIYSGGNAGAWTYTIYIETEDFDIGDEIAAYSGDIMVGSMVIDSDDPWENDLNTFNIAISGGYEVNSDIRFMAWDASENIDYYVGFEIINVNSSCYAGDKFPAGLDHFSYAKLYRGTVAVDENQIDNNVKVYPNPTNGVLNIESVSKIKELQVYNIYGSLVNVVNVNGNQQLLDMSNYVSGTYIVQLYTDTGVITKRIIVK